MPPFRVPVRKPFNDHHCPRKRPEIGHSEHPRLSETRHHVPRSRALHIVLDGIAERFIGEHIDAIVGIEARGFIFGGALAARLNASFVPVRKPGKLPAAVDRVEVISE